MTRKHFNERVESSRFANLKNPYSILGGVLNKKRLIHTSKQQPKQIR